MKDECFKNLDEIIELVKEENYNQIRKWGIQNHSIFEWLTYTTEEIGELAQALSEYHYRNGTLDSVIKEAIQTATLSLKIAEMFLKIKELREKEKNARTNTT